LILTRIAVMLSHPMPDIVSFATNSSNNSSIIFLLGLALPMCALIILISPWLLSTNLYQIPSQPIIINSSSRCLSKTLISGLQVIIC
jgi:Zn-dependent membrane protease YugP